MVGRIGEGQAGANAGFAGGRGCGKLDGDVVIWLGGTPGIEAYRREKKRLSGQEHCWMDVRAAWPPRNTIM